MRSHLVRALLPLALGAAGWSGLPALSAAQSPGKDELLRRTAAYVWRFVNDFSSVVAEEQYRQEFQYGPRRRRLTSDFLLVQHPGANGEVLAFRDVLQVDGRPVHDQQDRLARLFLEPFDDAVRRAAEIAEDGARHSVAGGRLANPLLVMAFLQERYQSQFHVTLGDLDTRLGPDVREIAMLEEPTPAPNRPPPLRARAWVEEATGRVVKTELRHGRAPATSITTTTFGFHAALGIDVPLEMRDSYLVAPQGRSLGADEFRGTATYGRFRRFTVQAEQTIESPADPR